MMMLVPTLHSCLTSDTPDSETLLIAAHDDYQAGLNFKAESKLDSAFFYLDKAENAFAYHGEHSMSMDAAIEKAIVLDRTGFHAQAISTLDSLAHLAETLSLDSIASRVWNNLGTVHYYGAGIDAGIPFWTKAYAAAERAGQGESACVSRLNVGSIGYLHDSLVFAENVVHEIQHREDYPITPKVEVLTLNLQGLIAMDRGQYEESFSCFSAAATRSKDADLLDYAATSYQNLQILAENKRDFQAAVAYADTALVFFSESASVSSQASIEDLHGKFQEAQTAATLAQTQLNAQKQQNRLLLLISALVIAGVILFMYARRQKAIRKAQTAAVLQAREQEQQRISQRLWQEIGKAMQQRDEQTSVFEGDQKTLDGAVQAAKYLSAQHFNPYLQVSLARALEFGCEQYGIQYGALITTEVEDVDVPMAQRKQLYKAFKRTLLDHLDTQGVDKLHVEMHAKEGRIELAITANEAPEKSVLYTAAEAEVAALGGKLKSKSDGAAHRTRIKVPIQG